jgi:hypothetical protein
MLMPFGSITTSRSHQLGFTSTIQLALLARTWIFIQGSFQSAFDKAFA